MTKAVESAEPELSTVMADVEAEVVGVGVDSLVEARMRLFRGVIRKWMEIGGKFGGEGNAGREMSGFGNEKELEIVSIFLGEFRTERKWVAFVKKNGTS